MLLYHLLEVPFVFIFVKRELYCAVRGYVVLFFLLRELLLHVIHMCLMSYLRPFIVDLWIICFSLFLGHGLLKLASNLLS